MERHVHFDRASLALLITIGVCIGTNEALIRLDYFVEGYTLRAARTKSNKAHLSYSQKIHPTSSALHRNLVAQSQEATVLTRLATHKNIFHHGRV